MPRFDDKRDNCSAAHRTVTRHDYSDHARRTGRGASGLAARLAIRRGAHSRHDRRPSARVRAGQSRDPAAIAFAADFLRFCELNPRPCPLIGVGTPGDFSLPTLGDDIDLRTDLPRYRVWRDGALVDEPTDLSRWWRDDLVSFAIGCSFSFEQALIEAGHRNPPHRPQMQRADVSYLACDRAGRTVPRPARGLDAAVRAGRRDPRHRNHQPLSQGARRAGAYRQAGLDRHHQCRRARLRRSGAGRRR